VALAISGYLDRIGSSIGGAWPFPIVVHGGARGADTLADQVARGWGWEPELHEVTDKDWDFYGRSAGHRRNAHMVSLGADVCLAFPLGESRGTRGCMKLAAAAGIFVADCSGVDSCSLS
jgi:hypothetical protein